MKHLIYFNGLLLLTILLHSPIAAAKPIPISEVQGDKQLSPFAGKVVTVRGIVTARTKNGFFIQTPDGEDDKNPKTSEGIFVFTGKESRGDTSIGNLVEVTGFVDEYRPKNEPVTLPVTEIKVTKDADKISVVSKNNALPKPIVLTATDFDADTFNARLEALERYEGMRVKITSLTVCAPTGGRVDEENASATSDGVFDAVLSGTPRPFRTSGLEFFETATLKPARTIPIFAGNPQILRVNSLGQINGKVIDAAAGATVKNVVGVVDYSFRAWTILLDADKPPVVIDNVKPTAVPIANENELTIGSQNLERFFDDKHDADKDDAVLTKEALNNRLQKASLVIRDFIRAPDVLAVSEVENLPTLQKLADKINADASGKIDLKYEAFLVEGNDIGGIDVGFLVNTRRVKVVKVEQFGQGETFKRPSDNKKIPVFDRPPLMLQATIKNLTFTVVANHLKSLRGVFDENGDTRQKRKLQAEFMANWEQRRQTDLPAEPLMLVGDFNAFQFSDGLVDVVGTMLGQPAAPDQVLLPTMSAVSPKFFDLVNEVPAAQRYSYVFAGNAQTLDHFLVNEAAHRRAARFGYARVNADFPEIYRNDAARPERISDHDGAVGYFTLTEKPASNR